MPLGLTVLSLFLLIKGELNSNPTYFELGGEMRTTCRETSEKYIFAVREQVLEQ